MSASNTSQWPERNPGSVPSLENERAEMSGIVAPVDAAPSRRGYSWLDPAHTSFTAAELRERSRRMRRIVGIVLAIAVLLLLTAAARTAVRVRHAKALAPSSEISQTLPPATVKEPAPPDTGAATVTTTSSPSSSAATKAPDTYRRKAEASRKAKKIRAKPRSS
jgi:hypothetical protein